MKKSLLCGGCRIYVTVEFDDAGKGVMPVHGHKRSCSWTGREVETETPAMAEARREQAEALRRETEVDRVIREEVLRQFDLELPAVPDGRFIWRARRGSHRKS